MQTPKNIKVVVFGNLSVGKTTLLNACVSKLENQYKYEKPFEHVSTMTITMQDGSGSEYKIELWDIKSTQSYIAKIIEEMQNFDFSVAIICYSVMELQSFEDVEKKWIPLVRKKAPQTHLMILGTKIDLRDDRVSLLHLDRIHNQKPISVDEGYKCCLRNSAVFHECSSFSQIGIDDIFYKIIKMHKHPPLQYEKKCSCVVS